MNDAAVVGACLSTLRAQWSAFTQRAEARLLVWQAEPDELPLISAFVDVESDAEVAETADVFLQLTSPFESGAPHGLTLRRELLDQYSEATRDAAVNDGPGWSPACASADDDDACALLRLLVSFYLQYGDLTSRGKLGVWLDPSGVADWEAYLRWLQRVVQYAPDEVRIVVVDVEPDPSCSALAGAEGVRVETVRCALDVPALLETLAAGTGESSPADRYRMLIVWLGNPRVGLERARAWAAEATEIGVALGQPALAAVAQLMVAAACSRHQQPGEALRHYAEGERHAAVQEATDEGDATLAQPGDCGAKVRLAAKLGGAAVQLSLGDYGAAGETYLAGAALAHAARDLGAELDCHRLASFCLSLDEAAPLAWEVGMRGLARGLGPGGEVCVTPALLQLAAHLLALTSKHRALRDYGRPLGAQLARALGPDWRAQLDGAGAA